MKNRSDAPVDRIKNVDAQSEVEAAWLEEIKRRTVLSDAGQLDDVDADDLDAEIRERYSGGQHSCVFEPEVLQAWVDESRRRLDALKSGEDPGLSIGQFFRSP